MTMMVNDRQIIISNPISMKQVSYGFWSLYFSHFKISTMNRFTRSMSGLLAFMAIWLTPQHGFGQCNLIVAGPQPVVVNITLNGVTGEGTLSGMNISAFVQSGDPGCSQYLFFDVDNNPLGSSVLFDCDDVQVAPHPVFAKFGTAQTQCPSRAARPCFMFL